MMKSKVHQMLRLRRAGTRGEQVAQWRKVIAGVAMAKTSIVVKE